MSSSKLNDESNHGRGELFLVSTPIGNLKDITLRALEVLGTVDRIACEDTRVSGGLLAHYGIKAPLISYHAHNEAAASEALLGQLVAGARIALISDAGTPLLSDPGARLVNAAITAGVRVTPIPGASALLSAVSIAGLPTDSFYYGGFLPSKTGARAAALAALSGIPATLVFYEAPHRLLDTLTAMHSAWGDREAAVARELTKLYEECVRGTFTDVIAHFTQTPPRGECVMVVAGAAPAAALDDTGIDDALMDAMQTLSVKEAVAQVAKTAGRAKRDIYARALAIKGDA